MIAKTPLEGWLETFGAAAVAAILPLMVGAVVQVLGTEIARAFVVRHLEGGVDPAARLAASIVVLLSGPPCVFLWARWAARTTTGSPVVRASIVGLGPAVLMGSLILKGGPFRSALAPLPWPVAVSLVVAWGSLHLGAGLLAGVLARRRTDARAP
jgi:hypothetical protein